MFICYLGIVFGLKRPNFRCIYTTALHPTLLLISSNKWELNANSYHDRVPCRLGQKFHLSNIYSNGREMEWKISQLIQIEKWNAIVVEKGWKIKFKLCGVKFWWNGIELELK